MHSDRYCGETVATILGGEGAWLWEYLPERAIKVFQDTLTAEVGDERPEEAVPSERIWRKLEDELVCHSCFADYIDVVKAHPPRNVKASLSDCSTLMGDAFHRAGAVDPVLKESGIEEGNEGEDNGGEEEDNGDEEGELQPHQRPPWHHLNDWRDLHLFGLHQLEARSWLPHLIAEEYGPKVWPMILIVMTIGIPQIGNSEFKLCSCYMNSNVLSHPALCYAANENEDIIRASSRGKGKLFTPGQVFYNKSTCAPVILKELARRRAIHYQDMDQLKKLPKRNPKVSAVVKELETLGHPPEDLPYIIGAWAKFTASIRSYYFKNSKGKDANLFNGMRLVECMLHKDTRAALIRFRSQISRHELDAANSSEKPKGFTTLVADLYNDDEVELKSRTFEEAYGAPFDVVRTLVSPAIKMQASP
jgi:hypothetical protein